jgi:hypothetical protein
MRIALAAAFRVRTHGISRVSLLRATEGEGFYWWRERSNPLSSVRWFSDDDGPKQRQVKVKKKPKQKKAPDESLRAKNLALVLAALDAPERKEPPISDEEKARRHEIGRNYVIGRFNQHNEIEHDLSCKIQMKKHAIKMLPRNYLREEALKPNDEMPPLWRHLPVWTPPIPGFDPTPFLEKEED